MFGTLRKHVTRLAFESFSRGQFGRGWVAFRQSEAEKARGCYDPHVMFIHKDSENYDKEVEAQVEQDCRDLARLLNRFGLAKEFLSEKANACEIGD